jgi:AcrR family transcriptional regulator
VPRTGRRPGEPATRQRIATVARGLFAEQGFDRTSIRQVAASAGVDPALVLHYFGSKRALFLAVTQLPLDRFASVEGLAEGDPSRVGESLVRFALEIWEDPSIRPTLLGILRSALTDPRAAAMLRDLFSRQGPVVVVAALAPSQPQLRTDLVASQIVGLALARYVLRVEPLASADPEIIAAIVGPTIQRYVTDELPAPKRRRAPAQTAARR